jgi:hypothetical protein
LEFKFLRPGIPAQDAAKGLILNLFGEFDVSYEQQRHRLIQDFRFAFQQLIKACAVGDERRSLEW